MSTIKQILKDLYKIDPSLEKHEQELIKIIKKLQMDKPDIKLNKKFARELKNSLMEKTVKNNQENFPNSLRNYMFAKKIIYSFGGAALVLLALVISIPYLGIYQKQNPVASTDNLQIKTMGKLAFGDLKAIAQPTGEAGAIGLGGGGGGQPSVAAPSNLKAGAVADNMILPAPDYKPYKYVYTGGEFKIENGEMEVLKKITEKKYNLSASAAVKKINLDLINMDKFSSLKIQNLNLIEDDKYGYIININPREDFVSIYQNWETWPQPDSNCAASGQKNCSPDRLKISDVPSDNQVIDITDAFLKKYEVNMKSYGKGEVDERWRNSYENSSDKNNYYIPDTLSVIYPLTIDGKKIYNQSGTYDGINVNVEIRSMKATGAWNISGQNYESSLYPTEQDTSKIIKLAERSSSSYMPANDNQKIYEVDLGAPELIYLKTYIYENQKNAELIVPAMSFPIVNNPDKVNIYTNHIIVPIIKELVDERLKETQPGGPIIHPMIKTESSPAKPAIDSEVSPKL